MKLKEMYEKVEQYNETIDSLHLNTKHLNIALWIDDWSKYEANTYEELLNIVKEEYIEFVIDALKNADFNDNFVYSIDNVKFTIEFYDVY